VIAFREIVGNATTHGTVALSANSTLICVASLVLIMRHISHY